MARKDGSNETDAVGEGKEAAARRGLVGHVEVVCEALIGSGRLTIGALDALGPGETLLLDSSPADPAEIRVNGKTIARGEVVTIDDRFAIRITEVG